MPEKLTPTDPPWRSKQAIASDPKPWPSVPGPDTVRFSELVELFRAPAAFDGQPGAACFNCAVFMALKVIDKTTKQEHFCATDDRCKAFARAKMKERSANEKREAMK